MSRHFSTRSIALALGAALTLVGGVGCSSESTPTTQASSASISQQWVKAAESGMTAGFAEISNTGDTEIRIVSASSPSSTEMEIHEMADSDGQMVMREKQGGLPIPAHSAVSLVPGGNHLMFMNLTAPVTAGDVVTVTLTFADGSTTSFDAQARDFGGNQENYQPSDTHETATHGTAGSSAGHHE